LLPFDSCLAPVLLLPGGCSIRTHISEVGFAHFPSACPPCCIAESPSPRSNLFYHLYFTIPYNHALLVRAVFYFLADVCVLFFSPVSSSFPYYALLSRTIIVSSVFAERTPLDLVTLCGVPALVRSFLPPLCPRVSQIVLRLFCSPLVDISLLCLGAVPIRSVQWSFMSWLTDCPCPVVRAVFNSFAFSQCVLRDAGHVPLLASCFSFLGSFDIACSRWSFPYRHIPSACPQPLLLLFVHTSPPPVLLPVFHIGLSSSISPDFPSIILPLRFGADFLFGVRTIRRFSLEIPSLIFFFTPP